MLLLYPMIFLLTWCIFIMFMGCKYYVVAYVVSNRSCLCIRGLWTVWVPDLHIGSNGKLIFVDIFICGSQQSMKSYLPHKSIEIYNKDKVEKSIV